jgi:hypothetical protein
MKIKTICAWCGCFISEGDFEVSKHCQALLINGEIISHGICLQCKKAVMIKYNLKSKRRVMKCGIGSG